MKSEFFAAGWLSLGQQQEVNKVTGKTASQLRIESSEPKICKNRERIKSRVCSLVKSEVKEFEQEEN